MPPNLRPAQQFHSLPPFLQLYPQCRSFHVCKPRRARGNDPKFSSRPTSKLPFPTRLDPSPHEIFHLPIGATQTQIKKRYLELVRMHHPDSLHTRDIPSSLAQSRFQSIAAAYDLLRNPHISESPMHREDDDVYMAEVNRRKAYYARHRGMGVRDWERQQQAMCVELDAGKWSNHDRAIMYAFGIIALGTVISHFATPTASEMVDRQHRRTRTHLTEAKERGKGRREEIRKWLEESNELGEASPYLNGFGDIRGRLPEGGSESSQEGS